VRGPWYWASRLPHCGVAWWGWLLVTVGALVALWGVFVGALYVSGRHSEARALAGFIPDCLLLVRGLLGDPRVRRRDKALLVALLGYLALPFDLVPDFIPVAGQLDDLLVVGWVLRRLVQSAGPEIVREHWRGPEPSLRLILRLAGVGETAGGCAREDSNPRPTA
jgi:uncharacterized membrane protein YkvA (DUF1232 family)